VTAAEPDHREHATDGATAPPRRPLGATATGGAAAPPWRALAALVRPERRTLAAATAVGLVASAAGLAEPLAAKAVIEALAGGGSLLAPILVLGALTVVAAGLSAAYIWLLGRSAERVVLGVRLGLGAHLLRLRVADLDRHRPGDLVARMTSDTTLLRSAVSDGIVACVTGAVSLVGAIVLMAILQPLLLAVALVVLSGAAGVLLVILPRIRDASQRAQAGVGDVGSAVERSLGAVRTVKASGAEPREEARIAAAAREACRHGLRGARYEAIVWSGVGLTVDVSFLVVLGVGGALAAQGTISVGSLVAFLLYLFSLTYPLMSLANGATVLNQGLGALARIEALRRLEREPAAPVAPGVPPPPAASAPPPIPTAPAVAFEDVTFRYRPELPPAIDGLSVAIPAGGQTAIVGPSGAGKTTLFALLERFYEPQSGVIRLAGEPLGAIPLNALRARLAYVEQQAPVLAGTLRENLVYARPDATEPDIAAVLEEARLTAVVDRLPDGLDTDLGGSSIALSGGERQRVAIARALLRRPDVLLLDEITSQLDAANELALRGAVERAARRCTVLVVAHRLSTVAAADRILVLKHGRLRALGTHAELLRGDDLYRDLAATQLLAQVPPSTRSRAAV
jgi:ABC-type multidrug transport system fused ATPase/permease subunit